MARIFISYRRDDTAGHAGWLNDRLSQHFGQHDAFRDIDTIEPGVDFVEAIQAEVGSCAVLLAMIGRHWLSVADERGARRLDNEHDFVRLEIATALQRNIRVIPVLVHGARVPRGEELPADLAKLARRNFIELRDTSWTDDVRRLIGALEPVVPTEAGAQTRAGGAAAAPPESSVRAAAAHPRDPAEQCAADTRTAAQGPQPSEQEQLLRELAKPATSHARRRDIGDRLAAIGDTRRGIGLQPDDLLDIEWLPVSGGTIEIAGRRTSFQPFHLALPHHLSAVPGI